MNILYEQDDWVVSRQSGSSKIRVLHAHKIGWAAPVSEEGLRCLLCNKEVPRGLMNVYSMLTLLKEPINTLERNPDTGGYRLKAGSNFSY
jgi:hypothetical protein